MIQGTTPAELNNRAVRELEDKLRPFVARRVRSDVDVDDVLQDVFLRVQRGLPSLRHGERFGPWVYRVTRSAVIDHMRAIARRGPPTEPATEVADEDDALDDRAAEQAVAAHIALFVSLLPSPYREALTLTELEGLTQKEAAELVGISLSGMKSRVQRGRKLLRTALDECCVIALDARHRIVACEPRPDGSAPDGCSCKPR